MGDKTSIEWADSTWNPSIGCDRVSPGCAHCYALEQAPSLRRRRAGAWEHQEDGGPASGPAFAFRELPDRVHKPLSWQKPRRVFVNSMSDLFHERASLQHVADVFAVMSIAEQHTFQVLTKRPHIMRAVLTSPEFWMAVCAMRVKRGHSVLPGDLSDTWTTGDRTLPNVWLGTSIELARYAGRADELRATPAAVRFISAEPLLGPLVPHTEAPFDRPAFSMCRECGEQGDVWWWPRPLSANLPDAPASDVWWRYCQRCRPGLSLEGIDWLIVGGESGAKHRPMSPAWVADLRDACTWSQTAFFYKQAGGRRPGGPALLDGREYREFPQVPEVSPA